MRQIHRPRPGGATGGALAGALAFLRQALLAKLMQLGDLPADLLPLGLFHFHQPHSPARGQAVQRHRQLAAIDHRHVARDVHVSLDDPSLFGVGDRRSELNPVAAQDVLFADLLPPRPDSAAH